MRIVINFKNTVEDITLYNELKKHSSMSGYIKDILKGIVNIENKVVNKVVEDDDIADDIADILD